MFGKYNQTPDCPLQHVTCDMTQLVGCDHSLQISAPQALTVWDRQYVEDLLTNDDRLKY